MKILFCLLSFFSFLTSVYADNSKASHDLEARKCADLKCIRENIDRINDQIIHLLGQRTAYVRRAGEIKGPNRPAHDQKRVEDELEVISKKSDENGVPQEIGVEVFKLLIKNSIEYQQKYKDGLKH